MDEKSTEYNKQKCRPTNNKLRGICNNTFHRGEKAEWRVKN